MNIDNNAIKMTRYSNTHSWIFWTASLIFTIFLLNLECVDSLEGGEFGYNLDPDKTLTRDMIAGRIKSWYSNYESMKEQGKFLEAIKVLNDIYNLLVQNVGPEESITVAALRNIASDYFEINEATKALAIYWKVYKIYEKTLGPTHLDTLSVLHDLGSTYYRLKNYEKALGFLKKVYKHRKEQLGPNHLDTILTLYSLANVISNGNIHSKPHQETALKYYRKAYDVQKKELGPDDATTLSTQYQMAKCLLLNDNPEEGFENYKQVHEGRLRTLEKGDYLIFEAEEGMANALMHMGKTEEASAVFKKRKRGGDQPDNYKIRDEEQLIHRLNGVAMSLAKEGKYEQALKKFLDLFEVIGENHANSIIVLDTIVFLQQTLKNHPAAVEYAQKLLKLNREKKPMNPMAIFSSWKSLALNQILNDDKDNFWQSFKQILEFVKTHNLFKDGEEDLNLLPLWKFAAAYQHMKKNNKYALELYKKVQKISLKLPKGEDADLKVQIEGTIKELEVRVLVESLQEEQIKRQNEEL